jgi:hypothetical protein
MMHKQVILLLLSNIVHHLFMIPIKSNQLNSDIFVFRETSVVVHLTLKKMVIKYVDCYSSSYIYGIFIHRSQKFIRNDFIYTIHTVLKLKLNKIQLLFYLLPLVSMKFVNIKSFFFFFNKINFSID